MDTMYYTSIREISHFNLNYLYTSTILIGKRIAIVMECLRINCREAMEYRGASCSPVMSVIVVTFNQELNKIIKTLDSVICQEFISFEIIICDDGSGIRFDKELKEYFSQKAFEHYKLINHDHNEGTVSNYYSGLMEAKGKYSKLLSPGDYLVGKKTLYNWVRFMEENNAEWSFADALYYKRIGEKSRFFRAKAKPQSISPYIKKDIVKCAWNYIVLHDIANGASILGTTNEQKKYCKVIMNKGIKYCEDYIYRLMMFYGNTGVFFPEAAISYEYGNGVSSSRSSVWKVRMLEDREKLIQIMLEEKEKNELQSKIVRGLMRNSSSNKLNRIFIKGYLTSLIKRRFFPRLTLIPNIEEE